MIDPTQDIGAKKSMMELAQEIHQTAVEHGWWESERNVGEVYMNISSEISEAWEEWRKGTCAMYLDGLSKPEGEGIELADAIIRILDYAYYTGYDMDKLIRIKMDYNKTRPYRHGGKRA